MLTGSMVALVTPMDSEGAVSYNELGNNDKYLEYANVIIEEKGVGETFDFAYNIYQQELAVPDWDTAAGWATRLKALTAQQAGGGGRERQNCAVPWPMQILTTINWAWTSRWWIVSGCGCGGSSAV